MQSLFSNEDIEPGRYVYLEVHEMNGEETFREIRRVRADVPVILTSGYNEIEATRRFTAKGLAGFLQKPFTPKELGQKLSLALKPGSRGSG